MAKLIKVTRTNIGVIMNFQAGQIRLVMGNELQPKVFNLTELKLYVFKIL